MTYTCLIVDDEILAQRLLEAYVLKMPQLKIVAKCSNALSALEILQKENIDILFLDIQMPDLTGLELLKIIKTRPAVILTTAYREYALDGFQLDVLDYLVKPIAFERFVQAVNKACEWNNYKKQQSGSGQIPQLVSEITQQLPKARHLFVKSDYKQIKINFDDIFYVEGLREYVSIFTKDKRIITLETMKNMEIILPANEFMRIHKSYIVNFQKIDALNGNMLEVGKEKIPIGKSYRMDVMKVLKLK